MEDREPYITGGNVDRLIKFSFMWQHQETGRWLDKRYTLDEIIGGDPYDDMSDNPLLRNYHHKHTRQYTSLKDKNGNPIYEGDIVTNTIVKREWICPKNNKKPYYRNMKRKTSGIVKWDDHWACWDFTMKTERGELEIIGNIYENKVDKGDK